MTEIDWLSDGRPDEPRAQKPEMTVEEVLTHMASMPKHTIPWCVMPQCPGCGAILRSFYRGRWPETYGLICWGCEWEHEAGKDTRALQAFAKDQESKRRKPRDDRDRIHWIDTSEEVWGGEQ